MTSYIAHDKKCWAVSQVALSSLLSILKTIHPTLPKDEGALRGTQKHVPITNTQGEEYYYFGIVKGGLSRLASLSLPANLTTLDLKFNIEGIPLFLYSKVLNISFGPYLDVSNAKGCF